MVIVKPFVLMKSQKSEEKPSSTRTKKPANKVIDQDQSNDANNQSSAQVANQMTDLVPSGNKPEQAKPSSGRGRKPSKVEGTKLDTAKVQEKQETEESKEIIKKGTKKSKNELETKNDVEAKKEVESEAAALEPVKKPRGRPPKVNIEHW